MTANPIHERIQTLVTTTPVVLFMKGNRRMPQCGFSAKVVQILDTMLPAYETVDVLSDEAVRTGIKEFSKWPTIPQLYIRGEFVGGSDIVTEMHASGELQKLLGVEPAKVEIPNVTITPAAAVQIKQAGSDAPGESLRLVIRPTFQNELYFDVKTSEDIVVETAGLSLLIDRATAPRASGVTIDFVVGPEGGTFKIENPNEPPRVRKLSAKELSAMLSSGGAVELFDVRPGPERALAKIARARALDPAGIAFLEALPRHTPIVFQCHHGVRSRAAAEQALTLGFEEVYNLEGGIAAWSNDVDPTVPQY